MEANEVLSVYTRREKVAFNAAYGNERVIAYLFLPRTGKPPFQVVVHWPGGTALVVRSIAGYGTTEIFEKHTRNGRAFVFPVLKGTFERGGYPEKQAWTRVPEDDIMRVKDFERTIDYLQTRPDQFDINKLAYEGVSWGAVWGGIVPAIETRIKVAIMLGGGLDLVELPPECSQVNFAPRIKIPILLQNGQYDAFYPVESSQKPFLELFGTAQKDKHHRIYEGLGHSTWLKGKFGKDELDFLDKYLGPAR
jgi:dienelactone hydrolase